MENTCPLLGLLLWMTVFETADNTPISENNTTSRHHKIHNVVLYPDMHSWCKLTPIQQVVNAKGCDSKVVENNVCVGTCFSFSVPRTIPETQGEDGLYYCDRCKPTKSNWITMALNCPGLENGAVVKKMVQIITNCSCQQCESIAPNIMIKSTSTFESKDKDNVNNSQEDLSNAILDEGLMRYKRRNGLSDLNSIDWIIDSKSNFDYLRNEQLPFGFKTELDEKLRRLDKLFGEKPEEEGSGFDEK